jgi:hypothetical protein
MDFVLGCRTENIVTVKQEVKEEPDYQADEINAGNGKSAR